MLLATATVVTFWPKRHISARQFYVLILCIGLAAERNVTGNVHHQDEQDEEIPCCTKATNKRKTKTITNEQSICGAVHSI